MDSSDVLGRPSLTAVSGARVDGFAGAEAADGLPDPAIGFLGASGVPHMLQNLEP